MTISRKLLLATGAAIALAGGVAAVVTYLQAAQGAGQLAQAPLNIQTNVPPAFIMAVDDSNSMLFERIFKGGDNRLQWNSNNSSFFRNNGEFFNQSVACGNTTATQVDCYLHLFPHNGYNSAYSYGRAIPPLDAFGFARSPAYNKSYFDPAVKYEPWMNANGTLWANAVPTQTRADPRSSSYRDAKGGNTFATAYAVTYNLTANRQVDGESFSVLSGMTVPSGTIYRSNGTACGNSSSNRLPSTSNNWSTLGSTITVGSNCNLQIGYFPATFYLPSAQDAPEGYRPQNTYRPVISGACGPGCDLRRYEIRPANYTTTAAYDAAIQNFANWFQYHRNRLLATVGAMSHAMQEPQNLNVGYFTINDRVDVTMRDVNSQREAVYADFFKLQAGALVRTSSGTLGGGTPNRDAVAYLGEQFRRTGSGAPIQLACQRNAGMLFTDGITNLNTGPTNIGNVDGTLGAPFADNFSNTIADIAARYYYSAAQGGLAPLRTDGVFNTSRGTVPIPDQCNHLDQNSAEWKRLDCQADLHMNFYGVTLGMLGNIYGVNDAATRDPYVNHPNWNAFSNPRTVADPSAVDEIWHATINSRGEFINADSPSDIVMALRRILSVVTESASPSGTFSLTGARVGAGTFGVIPSYYTRNENTDWSSTLTARGYAADPVSGLISEQTLWEASARLPVADARNILVGKNNGGAAAPLVTPFNASSVTLDDLCSNPSPQSRCRGTGGGRNALSGPNSLGVNLSQAVSYLRGNQALEGSNSMPRLRYRSTRLGDIINSTPVISSPLNDYGYRRLRIESNTEYDPYGYGAYLESKKSRVPVVYAGANDGMLHAFHGETGVELFGYIPVPVLGHMGNLLFPYVAEDGVDQIFDHRYYVDGPITVSDAHWADSWKTVLVGANGAGARGVFGMDVSLPTAFGAGNVLWDINDRSNVAAVKNNIGHVLGKPVIVPVKVGQTVRWKAIFGNGYNSINNRAALFVVDIATGEATVISAQESGRTAANGLGNIVVVDRYAGSTDVRASDGYYDTVYAADQNGAIWKFDLRSASPSSPDRPLFIAETPDGSRQAILGGLEAATGPAGGVMLYFGTGAFSFEHDAMDTQLQTLYGVNDTGLTTTIRRGDLHQQSIQSVSSAGDLAISSTLPAAGTRGWMLDLKAPGANSLKGERMVGFPRIESGVIFFPTYEPNYTDGCSTAGTNRLYGLRALTGGAAMGETRKGSPTGEKVGDGIGGVVLETGGSAPVRDVAVLAPPRLQPPEREECDEDDQACKDREKAKLDGALASRCWMKIQVAGSEPLYLRRPCGRQSWRQVR